MSYLRGQDRSQTQLLPPCLDDYVPANAPVRFIDAYVEGLDFQGLGFSHAQPSATGRPPYHPADLLKLYLYGYLNRIRSSRRLEAEAGRNLELMWLIRGVRPDFKTIADFRKDSRAAFKPLFKNFNLLCRQLGLFGAELVAIDGSKFKAVNNSRRHYTQQQLSELLPKIESRIEEYLSQLDEQDQAAHGVAGAPSAEALQEKLALLKERQGNYAQLLSQMQTDQQHEVSLTDADARKMKGAHGYLMAYNVQVAVDAKHDLIVAEEVVQAANDLGQLASVAVAAQTELQAKQLQVVADKGYHAADQLQRCEEAHLETFVPAQTPSQRPAKDGKALFAKEQFRYEPGADVYHCPGGQKLPRSGQEQQEGKERHIYSDAAACRACALRAQCTAGPHRRIVRRSNEEVVERAAQRVAGRLDLVARRKEIVEHVIGTLRHWGCGEFLMRGLEKVRAEFSLSALTYNLRRVLNLVPMKDLIAALQASRLQGASA